MNINEIQSDILRLKRENDVCILAHTYQAKEIIEVADYSGDSFQLSVMAQKAAQKNIVMCGVRFMAETVKLLSPEKRVLLANAQAGCPMAEQMDKQLILQLKEMYPDYTVVAYINTTAELKTVSDVCVTSSSAVKIVSRLDEDKILFIPDCNLGAYVAAQLPEKTFKFVQGGCPTHAKISENDVTKAKQLHPRALLFVHPECVPEVVKHADFVGSTSAIMDYARRSSEAEFIIGTETSISEHLQYECPDKRFYPLSKDMVCNNMKATTLVDVLNAVRGEGEAIMLDAETIRLARRCIDRMLKLG